MCWRRRDGGFRGRGAGFVDVDQGDQAVDFRGVAGGVGGRCGVLACWGRGRVEEKRCASSCGKGNHVWIVSFVLEVLVFDGPVVAVGPVVDVLRGLWVIRLDWREAIYRGNRSRR